MDSMDGKVQRHNHVMLVLLATLKHHVIMVLCADGTLRIAGGSSRGRLEIHKSGQWGTICDDNFDDLDATVACRQLGYASGRAVFMHEGVFSQGSGNIWLDEVGCRGTESRLDRCGSSGWGTHNCGHSEDVGVACFTTTYAEGSLRIVGGPNSYTGRLEVYHNGQWGTVCDDNWDDNGARVACRQMGYSYGYAIFLSGGRYSAGVEPTWLDNVRCSGSESRLEHCVHNGWMIEDCSHDEDAGILCSNTPLQSPSPPPSPPPPPPPSPSPSSELATLLCASQGVFYGVPHACCLVTTCDGKSWCIALLECFQGHVCQTCYANIKCYCAYQTVSVRIQADHDAVMHVQYTAHSGIC